MLTIIIASLIGIGVGYASFIAWGVTWGFICGIVVAVGVQIGIGLILRRKINAIQLGMQQRLADAQGKLVRKMQIMQQRGTANPRVAQQQLEQEQNRMLRQAFQETEAFKPYFLWSPMLKKQINTMKMALHYQLKEFDQVDALMKHCLFLDGQSIAMKIARMYKNNDPKLDAFFKSRARRLKGENCVLVYSLYAWIKVREEKYDQALAALVAAKDKTDNATIVENWERLVNGKVKHFSNAALGDSWYALYLEEPKIRQQRMVRQY